MLANLVGDPPLFQRFLVEIHRPPLGGDVFRRPVVAHLVAEQARGRLGAFDPEAAAEVLVGAVLMQGLIDVLGHRPPVDRERQLDAIATAILSGLAPVEPALRRIHADRTEAAMTHAPIPAATTETAGVVIRTPRRYDLRMWLNARGREGRFRDEEVRLARVRPGDRVLDLGCGTGSLTIALARAAGPSGRVVGVDPSVEMIGRARAKARRMKVPPEFVATAGEALPFPGRRLRSRRHLARPPPARPRRAAPRHGRSPAGPRSGRSPARRRPRDPVPGQRTVHSHGNALPGGGTRFDLDRIGLLIEHIGLEVTERGPIEFRFRNLEPLRYLVAEARGRDPGLSSGPPACREPFGSAVRLDGRHGMVDRDRERSRGRRHRRSVRRRPPPAVSRVRPAGARPRLPPGWAPAGQRDRG